MNSIFKKRRIHKFYALLLITLFLFVSSITPASSEPSNLLADVVTIVQKNYVTEVPLDRLVFDAIAAMKKEIIKKGITIPKEDQHQQNVVDVSSVAHFDEVFRQYERSTQIPPAELLNIALKGALRELDPYSDYLSSEDYKRLETEIRGSLGGVGLEITIREDYPTVVSPIEGSPAWNAGLLSGDRIVGIDGRSAQGISLMDAVMMLRGPTNSLVTLTVSRPADSMIKDYAVKREIIKLKSVTYKMIKSHIGYIRIPVFLQDSKKLLKEAVIHISENREAVGIILDLRNNPGGLLHSAVEVADVFLKSGVIVATRGRSESMQSQFKASDDGYEPTCPMIVLVNQGTASAAEIVCGALKDNKRALILGTLTFGKGSIQTVIPLANRSALKLTTAKYYSPSGNCIEDKIEPDVTIRERDGKDYQLMAAISGLPETKGLNPESAINSMMAYYKRSGIEEGKEGKLFTHKLSGQTVFIKESLSVVWDKILKTIYSDNVNVDYLNSNEGTINFSKKMDMKEIKNYVVPGIAEKAGLVDGLLDVTIRVEKVKDRETKVWIRSLLKSGKQVSGTNGEYEKMILDKISR